MFRSEAPRCAGLQRRGLCAALCALAWLSAPGAGAGPAAAPTDADAVGARAGELAAQDPAIEALVLTRLDGSAQEVAPAGDETLLLHFWASWCPSCLEEFAVLEQALGQCPAQRLRLYAVNVGDEADVVARFVVEHIRGLPVLRDPNGEAWRRFGGYGLPTNVYWSREASRSEVGSQSASQWRQTLRGLGCGLP